MLDDASPAMTELRQSTNLGKFITSRLETTPHLFASDHANYVDWRTFLAAALDVDPHCIHLVGSASLGVSFNPTRSFRPFGASSDIDVAVISAFYFDIAWRHLRSLGSKIYRLPVPAQNEIRDYAPGYVYWGVIATDRILGHLPFGAHWLEGLSSMAGRVPTLGRRINARLYRDLEALRSYQLRGFATARTRLLAPATGEEN